jgi:hypothetical protein
LADRCELPVQTSTVEVPTPAARDVDPRTAEVIDRINSGAVTETAVNQDLNARQPLEGFTVIVTVITEAQNRGDGKARFQTFVDVIGPTVPSEPDRRSICSSISTVLANRLSLAAGEIQCDLLPRTTQKRVTSSYVADMTVDSIQSDATHVVASAALAVVVLANL